MAPHGRSFLRIVWLACAAVLGAALLLPQRSSAGACPEWCPETGAVMCINEENCPGEDERKPCTSSVIPQECLDNCGYIQQCMGMDCSAPQEGHVRMECRIPEPE